MTSRCAGACICSANGRAGLGAGADLRLPTGPEEDLLGAGKTALKMFGIGSFEGGRFAAHVNAGGTVGGLGREFNYNGAATLAVAQHRDAGRRSARTARDESRARLAGTSRIRWWPT